MRKSLIILIAVALLGGGVYAKEHSGSGTGNISSAPASSSNINAASSDDNTLSKVPSSSVNSSSNANYKDGKYTGSAADTPYGTVQIAVVVASGKISDVQFLQMPYEERRSSEITAMSEPSLKQATLNKQSASIDMVSGATSTTYGYQESLQAALDKAKIS
jgi:uncharacterized protein with FMN-binding domain